MKLPTFIIAGERRCGTTSLYQWIKAHPDVFLHPTTDMNYFIPDELTKTRQWRDGEVDPNEWENTHAREDYARLFLEAEGFAAAGHKGADLLFWKPAHRRIAEFLPDAKFIVMLRNPVKRAWSHYWNEIGKGRERLRFEDAVEKESERSRKSAYARLHLSYAARGFYRDSLESFYERIDRRRVLVLISEQLFRRPEEGLRKIYKFLEVDENAGFENAGLAVNENWTTVPREWALAAAVKPVARFYERVSESVIVRVTKEAEKRRKFRKFMKSVFRRPASNIVMPEQTKRMLAEIYTAPNASLEKFLGYEIPEWKN
jgi:hypothetical protein